ncbi:PHD finger protein 7 [Halotydeus destructor]|nr:PHD finger protein 7 [Halotydeus destructor]
MYKRKKAKKGPITDNFDGCCLCLRQVTDEDDEYRYGELLETKDDHGRVYKCHYFCALFACALVQNGDETEGIRGFMAPEIRKEVLRGGKLMCKICKTKGATVGCSTASCNMTYHYPCGLKKGFQFNFLSSPFESQCSIHYKKQKASRKLPIGTYPCLLCGEELKFPGPDAIYCPECHKVSHRCCIQHQASVAGKKHFACGQCRNNKSFVNWVQRHGVYVPEKDADWERDGQFDDQVQEHHICKAINCICENGREFHIEESEWDIVVCVTCGHDSKHAKCGSIPLEKINSWLCDTCSPMLTRKDAEQHVTPLEAPNHAVSETSVKSSDDESDSSRESDPVCSSPNVKSEAAENAFGCSDTSSSSSDSDMLSTASHKAEDTKYSVVRSEHNSQSSSKACTIKISSDSDSCEGASSSRGSTENMEPGNLGDGDVLRSKFPSKKTTKQASIMKYFASSLDNNSDRRDAPSPKRMKTEKLPSLPSSKSMLHSPSAEKSAGFTKIIAIETVSSSSESDDELMIVYESPKKHN